MEGAYYLKTGTLLKFSEQQLVDCTGGYRNSACGGGYMTNCYDYLMTTKLMKCEDYPYVGRSSAGCKDDHTGVTGLRGHHVVAKTDAALMAAVAQQPVSGAVTAINMGFFLYRSGVVSANCNGRLDHAITIVGYGAEGGMDYWLVKNSWGKYWGDNGYVKI
jgi:KDEL-tailed cysteine endopeptidase